MTGFLEFFYKLVTTGKENKLEETDISLEESEQKTNKEIVAASKTDVKRMSTRRIYRHHSRGNFNSKKVVGTK